MNKKWTIQQHDDKITIRDQKGSIRFVGTKTVAIASFVFAMQEIESLKLKYARLRNKQK